MMLVAASSLKHGSVEDFEILYKTKNTMTFFGKNINLFSVSNEGHVIL